MNRFFSNLCCLPEFVITHIFLLSFSLPLFSQAPDSWTQKADLGLIPGLSNRAYAVGMQINGKGYIGAGYNSISGSLISWWEYNPVNNSWTQKADYDQGGTISARQRVVGWSLNGKGYMGGGWDGSSAYKGWFQWDPATNVWTTKNNLGGGTGSPRYSAAGFTIGNKGYVGTGNDGSNVRSEFWEYDPVADTWTAKASFAGGARQSAVGFSIGNYGYIGTGFTTVYTNDFWKYNPVTNSWSQIANLPGPARALASAFVINKKAYVVGGSDGGSTAFSDMWEYNPITNQWVQRSSIPNKRFAAASFSVGNTGYVGTGDDFNAYLRDLWMYTPLISSPVTFQKSYGGTNADTDTSNIAFASPTADGGYIISSTTNVAGRGEDVYMIKTDQLGSVQWQKTFGTIGNETSASTMQTSDGGYIVAGSIRKTFPDEDMLVMKISSGGNLAWSRTIGTASGISRANYAEETQGGVEYLIVGKGEAAGVNNTCVVRLSSTGTTQLTRNINVPTSIDEGFSLEQTVSGNYLIGGSIKPGANSIDAYVAIMTSAGNIVGSPPASRFDSQTQGSDIRTLVRQTPDGGYIFCGSSNAPTFTHGGFDFFLIKVQNNFTLSWAKIYGGSSDDFGRSLAVTYDGNYAVAGYTKSFGGNTEAFLTLLDGNGNPLWARKYGGSGVEKANSVYQTPDGGFILCGETFSYATPSTVPDIYLVKTDSLGKSGCNEAIISPLPVSPVTFTGAGVSNSTSTMTVNTITETSSGASVIPNNLCTSCSFPLGIIKSDATCNGTCNGTATAMASGGTFPYSYSWSTTPVQTTQVATGLCAGVYTVTVFDGAGCSATDTVGIKQPLSALTVTLDDDSVDICIGKSDTLVASASGGTGIYSYTWSPAAGLSNPTISNPVASPTAGTAYTVTVTDVNTCSSSAVVMVTVHSPPSFSAGTDRTLCTGTSTTLGSPVIPGVTYYWSPAAGLNSTTVANPVASPTGLTTYTVVVSNAIGCSSTDQVTVNVIASPTVAISTSSSGTVCSGTVVTLNGITNGNTYLWSPGGQSTSSIPASATTITTFSLTVTGGNNCTATATYTLNIYPRPFPMMTTTNGSCTTLCDGKSTATPVAGTSPFTYQWNTAPVQTTQTATGLCAGIYDVVVTDSKGCTAIGKDTIIQPVPVTVNTSPNQTICSGNTTTLSATVSGMGGINYVWNPGPQTGSVISVSPPTGMTNYTVIASSSTSGCADTGYVSVTVLATPTATITGPSTLCVGTQATLNGSGTGSYVWSPGGQTTTFITGIASAPGVFTYTLTVSNSTGNVSCSDIATHTVTVVNAPTILVSASSYTLCQGVSPDTLVATFIPGATYSWVSTPPSLNPPNDTIIVSPDNLGTNTYTVYVSAGSGCAGAATVSITVSPGFSTPVVTPPSANYCLGDSILPFVASNPTPPASIGWTDPGNTFVVIGTVFQPPQNTPVGSYTVFCLQGTNKYCMSYPAVVTMNINPLPTAAAGADVTICSGHTTHLEASGGTGYLWSPGTYLSDSTVYNPSASVDSTIAYQVQVTDANNCKDVDSVTVFISKSDTCGIHIYNGITPNGDGDNDVWWIDGIALYPDNFVEIFNRWGNSVWKGKGYDNRKVVWRGQNIQNQPLPSGTYYYVVDVKELGRFSKWVELTR